MSTRKPVITRHYENCSFSGGSYPNIKLLIEPVDERWLSLPSESLPKVKTPVFYFVYNFDNYYHFVYDTLPYLISYSKLKAKIPNLKLLVGFPPKQDKFNPFVLEFLELCGITEADFQYISDSVIYKEVYVSESYTHGEDSNLPPRKEVYEFFEGLASGIPSDESLPKKIYISRRSHLHGKYDNIGTNYTTRRNLKNEDLLVATLKGKGYTEVFTELMSTKEKIQMFKGCTHVVGAIGGGLCNVLFSKKNTKLTPIVSPLFLEVNFRFSHCFANVETTYFTDTKHTESDEFKKYMRVKAPRYKITGEISNVDDHSVTIIYDEADVAGWNAQTEYKSLSLPRYEVEIIDRGLNSEWVMNLNNFIKNYA